MKECTLLLNVLQTYSLGDYLKPWEDHQVTFMFIIPNIITRHVDMMTIAISLFFDTHRFNDDLIGTVSYYIS